MNNNEEFLRAFNVIENKLRDDINGFRNVPFYELVDKNSEINKLVKEYNSELKSMADLRNFVVHGDIGAPMAVVSDKGIKRINYIEKELTSPMKIEELFSKSVIGVREDTSLRAVLDIIKVKKYSQFPVLEGNIFKGLITENGITNWLANNIKEDCVCIKDVFVRDIIIREQEKESYSILYKQDTLYNVIEKFEEAYLTEDRTFVVIVLDEPKDRITLTDIYTMITPWDLDLIYKNLGLNYA